jgi:hypothetical protein
VVIEVFFFYGVQALQCSQPIVKSHPSFVKKCRTPQLRVDEKSQPPPRIGLVGPRLSRLILCEFAFGKMHQRLVAQS